jgi:hypothetical protein
MRVVQEIRKAPIHIVVSAVFAPFANCPRYSKLYWLVINFLPLLMLGTAHIGLRLENEATPVLRLREIKRAQGIKWSVFHWSFLFT